MNHTMEPASGAAMDPGVHKRSELQPRQCRSVTRDSKKLRKTRDHLQEGRTNEISEGEEILYYAQKDFAHRHHGSYTAVGDKF